MNRVFKNINIFLAKTSIFSKKNSKNWTYLTGIYEFFRKIIWNYSNFMNPINPEKFSGNSLIWLRNLQWRRKEFFRWERSGQLKTIKHPPQGVRGANAPRTVAKFHFLKRFKVLENESSFQKYPHFSCPKSLFFLRKIRKIEHIWQEFLNFFANYLKIFNFYETSKSRENFCEFYYLV